ncbi:hypothetical protein ABKN59_005150 [Abortiporus biennis]
MIGKEVIQNQDPFSILVHDWHISSRFLGIIPAKDGQDEERSNFAFSILYSDESKTLAWGFYGSSPNPSFLSSL